MCLQKRKFGHIKRHQGWALTEERPCEDTIRRRTSASRGEKPQQKPSTLIPWFWMSGFQNCEKINFCCLSNLVGGILLQKLWQTNTVVKRGRACVHWNYSQEKKYGTKNNFQARIVISFVEILTRMLEMIYIWF